MLLGKEQNVIGHKPEHVRAVAERHLGAYAPDDIDVLMKTVSSKGGIWAGLAPPHGAVLMRTPAEIRESYKGLLGAVNVPPPQTFVVICTDWYVFFESTGQVLDKASGQHVETHAISLFGNDKTSTVVDMAWPFGMMPDGGGAQMAGGGIRGELANLAAHERRRAGLAAGHAGEGAYNVTAQCNLFLPVFDPEDERLETLVKSAADYKAYLNSFFEIYKIEKVTPLNLLVRDQYVFSEYLWELSARRRGKPLTVRYALAEVVGGDGTVSGMLGFASRT